VTVAEEEVRSFVLDRLGDELSAVGMSPQDVPDDFDLLTHGVIDSFGILEMIVAIQERFGLNGDFEDMPAEELTIIGPFSRYVAGMASGGRS
jgi:acyl carrier protein